MTKPICTQLTHRVPITSGHQSYWTPLVLARVCDCDVNATTRRIATNWESMVRSGSYRVNDWFVRENEMDFHQFQCLSSTGETIRPACGDIVLAIAGGDVGSDRQPTDHYRIGQPTTVAGKTLFRPHLVCVRSAPRKTLVPSL
ncbi:hypothetical protein CBL_05312 [Carabus blaptoides fortunei]